jgi:hypothetical protein
MTMYHYYFVKRISNTLPKRKATMMTTMYHLV